MRDPKDVIIEQALQQLRRVADSLRVMGKSDWAMSNDKIADHLERKHADFKADA